MGRGADYLAWRIKMDKSTKNMCPNFTALNSRLPGGAKVGKAIIAEVKINQSTQEIQEPANKAIHCHTTCIKYPTDEPCDQPIKCAHNRKNGVRCTVRESAEHHDCVLPTDGSECEMVM